MRYGGVDGGGTSTRGLVLDEAGRIVTEAVSGPANVLAVGPERAWDHVGAVVRALALAPDEPLVLALAGSGRPTVRGFFEKRLRDAGFQRVAIIEDFRAAWAALTEGGPGLVAVVGTGSVVYGEGWGGQRVRAGGYGPRLGDPGSALWLAESAVRAVLRAWEGWGPSTRLAAVVEPWGHTPAAVLNRLYGDGYRSEEVAALAPAVLDIADSGDAVAVTIRERGVRLLAGQLAAAYRQLAPDRMWPVGVAGGLAARLLPLLTLELRVLGLPDPVLVPRRPVEGAALLARRMSPEGFAHA
jgi:N-acetylglucosamine kinase-like BadF-type ATPase